MPRVGSEQYEPFEYVNATSSGTSDVKTLQPTNKRAIGIWLTVEGTFAARVIFGETSPGAGVPPGLVIPAGTAPLLFPLPFSKGTDAGPKVKFASNGAGPSTISGMFVT